MVEENIVKDSELLSNIKRLTVKVLDNLVEGSENRTLDEQQKRLLSSTGARLLRLWRTVEREGESKRAADEASTIGGLPNRMGSETQGTQSI